ncbi:MAG: hypothetical protein JWO25_143 [Alphaproteobacteria bacterium]|nr:hypothetical protein [Alphaproteobacteria bacterium]
MGIANSRDITTTGFDQDALSTTTLHDTITNSGRLSTSGDLANGIFAYAGSVTIANSGAVTTSGAGAVGIFAIGDAARITNSGAVQTTGGYSESANLTADAIDIFGNDGRIDNSGALNTQGEFAAAIFISGDRGTIRNSGSATSTGYGSLVLGVSGSATAITNSGALKATDAGSFGIAAFGDSNSVTNSGSVTVQGAGGSGIAAFGDGNSLSNSGALSMTAGQYSVAMSALGVSNTLANRGSIQLSGAAYGIGMFAGVGAHNVATNYGSINVANAVSFAMGAAAPEGRGGTDLRLINLGQISSSGEYSVGMVNGAPRFDVLPGAPDGDARAWAPTTDGLVVNNGSIRTAGNAAAGILTAGENGHVVNTGRIETWGGTANYSPMGPMSASGIIATGHDLIVGNARSGWIETHNASSPAVQLNVVDGIAPEIAGKSTFENLGSIKAVLVAIAGGASEETVINRGSIQGRVDLGAGDDTYVAANNGRLNGVLFTGSGDDLVILQNGSGKTVIGDFQAGPGIGDVLDVGEFHFTSFAQVLAASRQSGSDVIVSLDSNDQLVLNNVFMNQLNADDFLLVSPATHAWETPAFQQFHSDYMM